MSDAPAAAFQPDTELVDDIHPSPNVNERQNGARPAMLVLHYTGLPSVTRSIEVLADPECQVSCHYVIDETGRITQMVPERLRAWHAGLSCWHGETDLNSISIGIEIQNPGHSDGYPDFPEVQMRAVIALAKDIITRHAIRADHVLAHSDVAPLRKDDPGEKFAWPELAAAGIGHWVAPEPVDGAPPPTPPAKADVAEAQKLFRDYGYDCPQNGTVDDVTAKVITAFQRHFRPARVDGRLDASTLETLRKLVAARPD